MSRPKQHPVAFLSKSSPQLQHGEAIRTQWATALSCTSHTYRHTRSRTHTHPFQEYKAGVELRSPVSIMQMPAAHLTSALHLPVSASALCSIAQTTLFIEGRYLSHPSSQLWHNWQRDSHHLSCDCNPVFSLLKMVSKHNSLHSK